MRKRFSLILVISVILRSSRTFFSFNRFQKQSFIDILQKQPRVLLKNFEMFLEAATHTHTHTHTHKISDAHFLSEAVVYWYLSEAVTRSLRKIEIHLGAATHLLKHKKYIQRQLHRSLRFLHKIYALCVKDFS